MVCPPRPQDKTASTVLDFLELLNKVLGTAGKGSVTVVQPREHEGADQYFSGVSSEVASDRADAAQFRVGESTHIKDMLVHGKSAVKNDTKISD